MDTCCDKEDELLALRQGYEKVLWIVLGINLLMFVVEMAAGWFSRSTALMADSLDMLGDSLVYGFSLLVLARNLSWQARASLLKGAIMLCFGIAVVVESLHKFSQATVPSADIMSFIGVLALLMNLTCFALLWRHKSDNINMQSTWICSRNDLIANGGVIVAALLTFFTHSKWPDLAIGLLIAAVFLRSAFFVIYQARSALAKDRNTCEPEHTDSCCK